MDTIKQVSAALVKAQRAFGPALKDKTNPAFRSKYADLGACLDAVMDALNANGIALVQRNIPCESGVTVETVFVHESGETLSSGPLHVPAVKQDPQGYGSALTYARRYSVMAACGIAPEDDDGNAATKARTGMAAGVLADWLTYIEDSDSVGTLKARVAEAEAACREVNDMAAFGQVQVAAAAKLAKAKAKVAA
jgi:hypothetical protein